jgi:hypothetical protein
MNIEKLVGEDEGLENFMKKFYIVMMNEIFKRKMNN